jgi:nucleoside-diphosphate-sugar epimerase
MKKILITGAAGFVGVHLARHLLADDNNLIVLVDNLQRGKLDDDLNVLLQNQRVTFIEADLTDINFYKTLDTDFNHVYHLAAVNGTKLFYEIPHEVLRINILSLLYILEWAKDLSHKPKICFTSSNEAYAGALAAFNQLPLPTPENVPLIVEDTYNPRWSYGATKLIGEELMIYYSQAFNFSGVIVRPHNFYGPRAGFDHVIPELFLRAHRQEDPFVLYGADETRSFCYITDAVEAMQLLMDSDQTNIAPTQTFHIGSSVETSVTDLAQNIFDIVGFKPKTINKESAKVGSVKRRLPDISKIKTTIDWSPQTALDEGLRKTWAWYKNINIS